MGYQGNGHRANGLSGQQNNGLGLELVVCEANSPMDC